uniref:Uncharacterized protein n=1 Tax=Romanomermis culicivorax TaxID=13658 RepID=A0A915HXR4_ROMCU
MILQCRVYENFIITGENRIKIDINTDLKFFVHARSQNCLNVPRGTVIVEWNDCSGIHIGGKIPCGEKSHKYSTFLLFFPLVISGFIAFRCANI